MRDIQLAGHVFDVDAMRVGKIEQIVLGVFGQVEQRLGPLEAELALHFLWRPALAGAQLPAIAARCAIAETVGVDQRDRHAFLGKIVGGLQAGKAAADDDNVTLTVTVEPLDSAGGRQWQFHTRKFPARSGFAKSWMLGTSSPHTFSSRNSRSQGLITCMNVSNSPRLTPA